MVKWISYGRLPWLIGASLLLLALFEGFWLCKSWSDQKQALTEDLNHLFVRTIMDLQDTLVRRSMASMPDSNHQLSWTLPPPFNEALPKRQIRFTHSELKTSVFSAPDPDSEHQKEIRIIITSSNDSFLNKRSLPVENIDRMLVRAGEEKKGSLMSELVLRIEGDSVDTREIETNFARQLATRGLPTGFRVTKQSDAQTAGNDVLKTEPAPVGLLKPQFFEATFTHYRGFLFRRILPNLLFALFLFGITALAFGAIFRNLQEQRRLAILKNDFISNISHELKTPITTVGVALEAMSDFAVLQKPEKSREYLAIAQTELDRLRLLVEKVLHISGFEQGQMPLHREKTDLVGLVAHICAALQLQAEKTGIHLEFEAPSSPVWVLADRLHLSGVVYNLLDNALKYAPGTDWVGVHITTSEAGIVLSVQDKGPGVPAEFRRRIFEKFFRVPSGDRHNIKGHGLGLSYAADVVRQHGGTIEVDRPESGGCVFTVKLPPGPVA